MSDIVYVKHSAVICAPDTPCAYIANPARICYGVFRPAVANDAEANRNTVRRLIRMGHLGPLEFLDMTFWIVTTRAVANELVRHRIASYLQESQRYCRYDEKLEVILPDDLDATAEAIMRNSIRRSYCAYLDLMGVGVKPEDARVVLPTCVATRLACHMNLRSFRNFLDLRLHKAAWREMRRLAHAMKNAFYDRYPHDGFLVDMESGRTDNG